MVIAGSGPLLLAVADTVNKAGGEVTNIIEQAPLPALLRFAGGLWRWPQKLRQLATLAPKGYLSGAGEPRTAQRGWKPLRCASAASSELSPAIGWLSATG